MRVERRVRRFVPSLMNVLLVLGVCIVLFPLSTPTAKADILWYDDWHVSSEITLDDDTIILNGTLYVHDGGKLTLDNCILQIQYKSGFDNMIQVEDGGTFNVTNNSLITIYSSELTDRYEFKIYTGGKALIEDSTVEYMVSSGSEDGIEIYSNDVTIKNSLIQNGDGNGITISGSSITPRISFSAVINNGGEGIYCINSASPIIENCNITSNSYDGIYAIGCSNMEIRNNTVSNNGVTNSHHGIYLSSSSNNNNIVNNTVNSNGNYGIGLYSSSNSNTVMNNIANSNGFGIFLIGSTNNDIINNTFNSNGGNGVHLSSNSNDNTIHGNTINSNNQNGIYSSSSNNNEIVNNTISSNGPLASYTAGIYFLSCYSTYIINNTITLNQDGIYSGSNYNTIIYGNNISDNINEGIHLVQGSHDNSIINNTIYSNNYNGIYFEFYLEPCNNNTITMNNISANNLRGIYLVSSFDNKIGMNTISSNTEGINLTDSSNRNLITSNDLFSNTNYGIYLGSSSNNEIIDNNMTGNNYGVSLDSSSDNNLLYHNNFKNDVYNASDSGNNQWDNGLEGNWWAGWADNPDTTDTDGNGICEQSYSGTDFTDSKPLFYEDNDRVLVDDPWFWFIQSGVNFAEPGWTVYATSSTYLENVTINKTLTIIGEDRNTTIIDAKGNESVILVDSAFYVNVSEFTVRNGTYGIRLKVNSNYTHIFDNNISKNTYGINITQSSNVIVENNTIQNNDVGVLSYYSSPIIRYNNISFNNNYGITNFNHSNAIIGNNTIQYNGQGGITNILYSNATIDNNTISYNYFAIRCGGSSPTITFNNITFNTYGIYSHNFTLLTYPPVMYSSDPTIHWDNICNNSIYNLSNSDTTITINAENNYWGLVPPNRFGILGRVDFIPFVMAPIEEAGPG